MPEIVEGEVRDCDFVAKLKIAKLFSHAGVFVGDSRKIMLAKFPAIL